MCRCCEFAGSGYANRSLGENEERGLSIEKEDGIYYLVYWENDEDKFRVPVSYCPLCGLSLY